jgi:uncharacterized protein Yka (UPF0111/DUF47 family)
MSFSNVVRLIFPRDDRFYGILEEQGALLAQAGKAVLAFVDGELDVEAAATTVQGLEPKSDAFVHQLEDFLGDTFVTPIDREDIHELSTSFDDLLAEVERAIRAAAMLGIERPSEGLTAQLRHLGEFVVQVAAQVPNIRAGEFLKIVEARRNMRRLEKAAHKAYRDGLSALFLRDGVGVATLLREKSVHDAVEDAVNATDETADVMAGVALKLV